MTTNIDRNMTNALEVVPETVPDEIYWRAVMAWWRFCQYHCYSYTQPNRWDSQLVGDVVELITCERLLARYRIRPDGRLRRLSP